MPQALSLEDLEIRYDNIRKSKPQVRECSVSNCHNPRDSTEFLGEDSSCAYHRLLFDFWACEVMNPDDLWHYLESQKGRRRAFTNWRNKIGKIECDRIVLRMMKEPINWSC